MERREGEEALTTTMFTELDHRMMRRALELAALGRYSTPPNPAVGCVIAQGERIVGEGWHRKSGEAHAEPLALAAAGDQAKLATAYVTLEPHSYHSRTPPCTDALIRAGVKRVVCAAIDANPQVAGNGIAQLKHAGVDVQQGLLDEEAQALNAGFTKRMRTGLPRVIVKIAASLDGRTALANGRSRWLTGEGARADVQRLRAASSAILTGVDTVIADDPQLTVRDASLDLAGRVPLRVVVDTKLRTPVTARLLREAGETVVFTGAGADNLVKALRDAGASIERVPTASDGRVDIRHVFAELGRRQCNDVLVEAGPTLAGHLLREGCVDELIMYVAPILLGQDARPTVSLPLLTELIQAPRFGLIAVERFGDDVKLTYRMS